MELRMEDLENIETMVFNPEDPTQRPDLVVCHRDVYEIVLAAVEDMEWPALGTKVQASNELEDVEKIYFIRTREGDK